MTSRIEQHFAAIRGIDARAEIEQKRICERLAFQQRKFKANHWEPARKAAKAIERAIRRRLDPHGVEFVHCDGWHIDHRNMSVHPSFSFEVFPRKAGVSRFAVACRAPIKVGLTVRDEAEFDRIIAGIRSAADALAVMLYTAPERQDDEQ